jgi:alkaline phosphatase
MAVVSQGAVAQAKKATAKNVILLIPDGTSLAPETLSRWIKGSALSFDKYTCGLVETYNSDATIADSAPAGSAFATGYKSQTGNIASTGKVYTAPGFSAPALGELRPVATVLEAAKLSGRSTGLISTSEFMHATPADFAGHDPSRKNYDGISEQIIFNNVDVVLGGGWSFLEAANRADKDNVIDQLAVRGYTLVKTPDELKGTKATKLFGLFAPKALAYDLDRDPAKEPGLDEMTSKAISTLSANKKGFFLMVEGSKVDWAAHANDPVGIISDILAFDKACKAAFDFAEKDKNTIVIVVSDHGNSGFSIGDKSTSGSYDKTTYNTFFDPIKKATKTGEGLEALIAADKSNIKDVVAKYYGIADLTDDEVAAIAKAAPGALNAVIGPMMGTRAKIGFTTGGHTGEDVVLSVYDPSGNRPTGVIENVEIAKYIERSLGLDLAATTNQLFVEAESAFAAKKAEVSVDATTDPANVRLVAKKGDVELAIVQNRDYAIVKGLAKTAKGVYVLGKDADGKEILALKADGVTVNNGKKWFVSQNLIDAIK